jgi:hypothetical protein
MYIDTCQFCEKCPDIAFMCQRSCEFPNILTPQWERAIDEQPTVDAVPVRHGKWNCGDDMFEYAICSACKWDSGEAWEYAKKNFIYCPNCGARMKGADDE